MSKNNRNQSSVMQRISWRLHEASSATGLSVPFLRKKIRSRELKATNAGSCVLIMDEDLRNFLNKGEK